jgi:L-lactate dehydrogenase (cytochrome)
VLKARALGARGVWLGRAYVYGLAALGEAGVMKALQILHEELDLSMAFCGHTRIDEVGPHILVPGTAPGARGFMPSKHPWLTTKSTSRATS